MRRSIGRSRGLRFLWEQMPHHRGFFYHWANITTGERLWDSEDLLHRHARFCCAACSPAAGISRIREIERLAHQIFNRVDWNWLSEDTRILPHGWRPETGFLQSRWENYSEMMMMYLLGLGLVLASAAARGLECLEAHHVRVSTASATSVRSRRSSFTSTRRPGSISAASATATPTTFRIPILATDVHRRFCLDLAGRFSDYSDDLWGITASDSPKGYAVWGGPPATGPIDGTVVPSAAAGSLPFLPTESMRVLRTIRTLRRALAWSRYGFVNAFNPLTKW